VTSHWLLVTSNMSDCLFCKIVARQIPAYVVYENDHVLAFLDVTPRSPGHTVVIPKTHAPTIVTLPDAELAPLFAAVKKVDQLLLNSLAPDGMTIGINQGKASGQEVDHLHVHLVPRWHGDGGHAIQSVVNDTPKESLESIQKKILEGK
jgi:histidine triad (HIT) family protein